MKHFTSEEWIDFVNQVASPTWNPEMETHLEACEDCGRTVSTWRKIRRAVAAEMSYQPPREAVRMAKAAYSASEWGRRWKAPRGMIEILFDSYLQPEMECVRSGATGTRR